MKRLNYRGVDESCGPIARSWRPDATSSAGSLPGAATGRPALQLRRASNTVIRRKGCWAWCAMPTASNRNSSLPHASLCAELSQSARLPLAFIVCLLRIAAHISAWTDTVSLAWRAAQAGAQEGAAHVPWAGPQSALPPSQQTDKYALHDVLGKDWKGEPTPTTSLGSSRRNSPPPPSGRRNSPSGRRSSPSTNGHGGRHRPALLRGSTSTSTSRPQRWSRSSARASRALATPQRSSVRPCSSLSSHHDSRRVRQRQRRCAVSSLHCTSASPSWKPTP